jgi:hypothetical protein
MSSGCRSAGSSGSPSRRVIRSSSAAIVGEKEPRTFRDALSEVTSRAPQAVARLVPGMHHVWSVEDPELFHDTLSRAGRLGKVYRCGGCQVC